MKHLSRFRSDATAREQRTRTAPPPGPPLVDAVELATEQKDIVGITDNHGLAILPASQDTQTGCHAPRGSPNDSPFCEAYMAMDKIVRGSES